MAIKSRTQALKDAIMGAQEDPKVFGESSFNDRLVRKLMRRELESLLGNEGNWDGMYRQTGLQIARLSDPLALIENYFDQHGVREEDRRLLREKISRVRSLERGD